MRSISRTNWSRGYRMDQVEFSFYGDNTIIEFRNRVQEQIKTAEMVFGDPAQYSAVAASLWFAMEMYEKTVIAQMQEKGPVPPIEYVHLHNLVHLMRDILEQMFGAVGMKLTDIPMVCPPKI